MRLPSVEQAHAYLAEGGKRNPGLWVSHSMVAAETARRIAEHHPTLDAHAAYVINRSRRRKHLGRPREIEDLDIVEGQNAHGAWLSTIHMCCGSQGCSALIARDIQRRAHG